MDDFFYIKHKPGSFDEINIFDLKNRFMYAILTNILLADKGKSLVSQDEGYYNAHAIRKDSFGKHGNIN